MGVTLVNRIIQVSSVDFYDLYTSLCAHHPKPTIFCHHILGSLLSPHLLPSGNHHVTVCAHEFQFYVPCMSEII